MRRASGASRSGFSPRQGSNIAGFNAGSVQEFSSRIRHGKTKRTAKTHTEKR
jgi:hypothetical protein